MKAVAFVPVRLTSSRLPEKHLKLIGNKPLIYWVVKRLKDCKELDEIVICVPDEPENEKLKDFCEKEKVNLYVYKGNANDVVGRLTEASKYYNADICVLASGDCPLLSSETIDKLVAFLKKNPEYHRVVLTQKNGKNPIHEGISVVRREVWELADKLSKTPELREHQFPIINICPEKFSHFKTAVIEDKEIFYALNHRISVDTPSDLEFMNKIYEELAKKGKEFNLENVVKLLIEKPELKEINQHVYRKNVKDKDYKILIFASAVSTFGFGNLMRALEISGRLVDEGLGVTLAVLDETARNLCVKKHVKAFVVENYEEIMKYVSDYDAFVFDINKNIKISKSFVQKLKEKRKKVIFIDNINEGALISDLIIIPTAHYTGKNLPNLLHGAEYVVIRRDFFELKRKNFSKKGIIARVDDEYREYVKKLWKSVNFVNSFSESFCQELANSSVAILHLGLSCYESLYVNTPVIIIPRDKSEIEEIEKFYEFSANNGREKLGDGAKRIAKEIKRLINEGVS